MRRKSTETGRAFTSATRVAAVLAASVVAITLAGCNIFGPRPVYDTADATVYIAGESGASASEAPGPSRAVGETTSPEEISRVELSVAGEDRFGVYQDPLATLTLSGSGASWSGSVPALPLGPTLSFTVEAFDADDNLIYTASTTAVLDALQLSVALILIPFDDAVSAVGFPVIREITRPAEIVEGTEATVSVSLEGSADETLEVVLASGGGVFTPAGLPTSPIDVPLSSGAANLDLTYSASEDAPDTYLHTVRAENEQGNSVSRDFTTTVVWETADGELSIGGVAPAVTGFDLSLDAAGDMVIEANVTDDGPLSEITYEWSFDGGLSFADSSVNPATLTGYDETATGTVTLTVTDSDTSIQATGLSSTVDFVLPAGVFPDEVQSDAASGVVPILFAAGQYGSMDIYRINPDGTERSAVAVTPHHDDMPDLSPDGTKIVFISDQYGSYDVFVMNADGSERERLTSTSTNDHYPEWSPDGTTIVFARANSTGGMGVHLINADGSGLTTLVSDNARRPTWSPDGTQIAYFGDSGSGFYDIFIVDVDGPSTPTNVTLNSNLNQYVPSWGSNNRIAFYGLVNGNGDVYTISPDGSSLWRVTTNPGSDFLPRWSPDASRIVFRGSDSNLYLIDADGANRMQLTSDPVAETSPSW